jgi:hypothetical protein
MMMVAEIKKAILRELAVKGYGYAARPDRLSDEAVRAIAELIHEGCVLEGDCRPDQLDLFITRKGLDAAETLQA